MMIQAVLGNPHHPEYGVATIPFPIPHDQYAHCMPCAGDCERDMDDVPQVPENIRPLLMLSGCCPSALAQLLEEGDIVYAAE